MMSLAFCPMCFISWQIAQANILTIHQSIPINGIASLTLSVEILPNTGDLSSMVEAIEKLEGIQYLKILARE